MVLACLEAFFAQSSKTPSKKQEPLTCPISWHQTAGSSNWRNILASKDIDGGRAKLEVLKLSFSLGISQNKGTEAIQPCSFSSFYLALLAFYVVSLLWFQAFLIFFLFIFQLFLSALLTLLSAFCGTFYYFLFWNFMEMCLLINHCIGWYWYKWNFGLGVRRLDFATC